MDPEALSVGFSLTSAVMTSLYYLTSRPYPVEVLDGLQTAFGLQKGDVQFKHIEALDAFFTLHSAALRELVHSCTMKPEAMDVSYSMQSATLRNVVHDYQGAHPEALDAAFNLQSASLRDIVITYTMKAEALDIGFGLVSATLQ